MIYAKIEYLDNYKFDKLQKATKGSSGFDLYSCEDKVVHSGKTTIIPCGIKIELTQLVEAQIRSRSGLSAKHGVFVLNSPGTIDSDYRGEISVIIANFSDKEYHIKIGDRIAQIVFVKLNSVVLMETDCVNETKRGDGKFGSTGK